MTGSIFDRNPGLGGKNERIRGMATQIPITRRVPVDHWQAFYENEGPGLLNLDPSWSEFYKDNVYGFVLDTSPGNEFLVAAIMRFRGENCFIIPQRDKSYASVKVYGDDGSQTDTEDDDATFNNYMIERLLRETNARPIVRYLDEKLDAFAKERQQLMHGVQSFLPVNIKDRTLASFDDIRTTISWEENPVNVYSSDGWYSPRVLKRSDIDQRTISLVRGY